MEHMNTLPCTYVVVVVVVGGHGHKWMAK
jgi:hypothetical protein